MSAKESDIDRYASADRLVRLALMLSEAHGGLTVEEMAARLGVSVRTVHRVRNRLAHIFGGAMVELPDGKTKRWALQNASLAAFVAPTADELAELRLAIERRRKEGWVASAEKLDRLAAKLESTLSRRIMRRLEPDIEGLLEASGMLARPGPQIRLDSAILDRLRRAILQSSAVRLAYVRRSTGEQITQDVLPYGVLSGSRGYLVALKRGEEDEGYRLYALTNIRSAEVLDLAFVRDPEFNLDAFAARSFGVFWDDRRFDVVWRFSPAAAADARAFLFHPGQTISDEPDGSIIVRFCASGLQEMAWDLFRWGDTVEIIAPPELRMVMQRSLAASARALAGAESGPALE